MAGFGALIDILKKDPKKIVFTEGTDPRIIEASSRLLGSDFLQPILIGKEAEIKEAAEEVGFNIRGAVIIDPDNYDRFDEMCELFCELRKSKGVTMEQAAATCKQANYFGTMLVKMGVADALLGGATYSTADTVRPALQVIKTKPGNSIVSSCFIMVRNHSTGDREVLAMGDCAINIKPNADELAEIGISAADTAKRLCGIEEPKVAFLSFSTKGSAKHELVTKVQQAVAKAHELAPDLCLDGEMQFDAALVPEIGASKAKGSPVAGHANVLIFPDLQAGNIGYKITQRIGGAECFAVLQGLAKPCNDLSRGCSVEDIVNTVAFTAVQAQ